MSASGEASSGTDMISRTVTTSSTQITSTMDQNTASVPVNEMVTTVDAVQPRESLITTAVNFLQNAKIRHRTLMQKQQFLRSKGLTMEEMQLACERAGVFSSDVSNEATTINVGAITSSNNHNAAPAVPYVGHHTMARMRNALQSMAMLSAIIYAGYVFYKKFVEAFVFGRKKKSPEEVALEKICEHVEHRLDEFNRELSNIKDSLAENTKDQTQQINREFTNFRNDIEAIKGLLLNSKQFNFALSGVPASIPTWQLTTASHRRSPTDDNEKTDDAGSGSGSSETEVVTKNSDSSLEIV